MPAGRARSHRFQLRRRLPSRARQARRETRTAACDAPAGHSMNVSERTRIELPEHVPPVFDVYVGGVRQVPGRDFEIEGRSLVFPRPVEQEGRLGFWRWASMWLGIAGTYRKHETVDVAYEADGRREVATGLQPQPYESD